MAGLTAHCCLLFFQHRETPCYNHAKVTHMGVFIDQIISILTSPPGSLTYHLVLAFSITGALHASLTHWRSSGFPQSRRLVIGLSLLLALRLALFLVAGLSWQGLISEQLIPPIERGANILGLITIIWLWAFPEPTRQADAGALLLGLLALTSITLGLVWWSSQDQGLFYNGSWGDYISEISSLVLLAAGALILLLRKPNGWGYGLSNLALLALGHGVYLLLPNRPGDYSGIVRLAQMTAYPLLLTLPNRFPLPVKSKPSAPDEDFLKERRRLGANPELIQTYMALVTETAPPKTCRAITSAVSQSFLADICLLISPPDEGRQMVIHCGYDLIREENLEGATLDGQYAPVLASALQRGRGLHLPASSTSPDLQTLASILNLDRAGHLLSVPVQNDGGEVLAGIVLLSPYSNRGWTNEDQSLLGSITQSMAYLLQRTQLRSALQDELIQTRQTLKLVQDEADEARREYERLHSQIRTLNESQPSIEDQDDRLAALVAAQEQARQVIANLRAENEKLSIALQDRASQTAAPSVGKPIPTQEREHLEGELRLALQEVARLNKTIARMDRMAISSREKSHPLAQIEAIASIAMELRQSMTAIIGYTDFLLGESIGILGDLQRKFLEKVLGSTRNIGFLVDELVQITALEADQKQVTFKPIDLSSIIDEAIKHTSQLLREKDIALRVDMPERLPKLNTNRNALQGALIAVLENASSVTPDNGEISLLARIEQENDHRYVLVQIADQGSGISADEMFYVFSPVTQQGEPPPREIGEMASRLTIAKSLLEGIGARLWVESQSQYGSTLSILLPTNHVESQAFEEGETPQ
jgi:signal transduction histidine kinase